MGVHAQIMDMFVEQTHVVKHEMRSNEKALRYTDTRLDEQVRADLRRFGRREGLERGMDGSMAHEQSCIYEYISSMTVACVDAHA